MLIATCLFTFANQHVDSQQQLVNAWRSQPDGSQVSKCYLAVIGRFGIGARSDYLSSFGAQKPKTLASLELGRNSLEMCALKFKGSGSYTFVEAVQIIVPCYPALKLLVGLPTEAIHGETPNLRDILLLRPVVTLCPAIKFLV
jgi:hypothetical protein